MLMSCLFPLFPAPSPSEHTFEINRERAIDYLNTRENVYVFDGFAGWDPKYRIKVRVIASRAYHALFMVSFPLGNADRDPLDTNDPNSLLSPHPAQHAYPPDRRG